MAGYHHCKHCDTYHECNKSESSCLTAVAGLFLVVLLMPPIMLVAVGYWASLSCEQWPNWTKACEDPTPFNKNLSERIKKLEEK